MFKLLTKQVSAHLIKKMKSLQIFIERNAFSGIQERANAVPSYKNGTSDLLEPWKLDGITMLNVDFEGN